MSREPKNNKLSKMEQIAREYFKYCYPSEEVIYNHRPDWLKNPNTGFNLELDIYFPNMGVAFEINGAMHNLTKQIERDEIKQRLCIENQIELVSIFNIKKLLRLDKFGKDIRGKNPKLYYKIVNYKPKKGSFGNFDKRIKFETRSRENKAIQDKEREFNRQKILRMKQR